MIIIPDIHGRLFWEKPVKEYLGHEHIVFLGDYVDPYHDEFINRRHMLRRLGEIINLKRENPDSVTLLLGNHDLQYLDSRMRAGRYDFANRETIRQIIEKAAGLFQITFTQGKYLFTHAGLLEGWIKHSRKRMQNLPEDDKDVPEALNTLWNDPRQRASLLLALADTPTSRNGMNVYGSPVWSDAMDMRTDRPEVDGFLQVFGHTYSPQGPILREYFACIDCGRAFRLTEDGTLKII